MTGRDTRKLIIHADDLGLTNSFNEGVRIAYREGLLTSTSLRANGAALDDAIERVLPDCRGIGVGLHLNIVEGRTARKLRGRRSMMCDQNGYYRRSFGGLLRASVTRRNEFLAEVEDDYREQIESVLERGIEPDHRSSHQHSHAIPGIFGIACKLAVEYSIPYVRLPRERLHFVPSLGRHLAIWYPVNLAKFAVLRALSIADARIARGYKVDLNSWFVGILYTGHMDSVTALRGLSATKGSGQVTEVLFHPCGIVADKKEQYLTAEVRDYSLAPERTRELETLRGRAFGEAILRENWELTCYGCLASADRPPHDHSASAAKTSSFGSSAKVNSRTHVMSGGGPESANGPVPRLRTVVIMDETRLSTILNTCEG